MKPTLKHRTNGSFVLGLHFCIWELVFNSTTFVLCESVPYPVALCGFYQYLITLSRSYHSFHHELVERHPQSEVIDSSTRPSMASVRARHPHPMPDVLINNSERTRDRAWGLSILYDFYLHRNTLCLKKAQADNKSK